MPAVPETRMLVVLDIETQQLAPVNRDLSSMRISIAGVRADGNAAFYREHELPSLFALLDAADVIVGFNLLGFDYPVLRNYASPEKMARWQAKTYDLMMAIEAATGRMVSLNDVATRTLGIAKSGSGGDAPALFAQGRMDELQEYLGQDLLITDRLVSHLLRTSRLRYGHITYRDPVEREVILELPEVLRHAGCRSVP